MNQLIFSLWVAAACGGCISKAQTGSKSQVLAAAVADFKVLEAFKSEAKGDAQWIYVETVAKISKEKLAAAIRDFEKTHDAEVRTAVFYFFQKNEHYAVVKHEQFVGSFGAIDTISVANYENLDERLGVLADSATILAAMKSQSVCLQNRVSGQFWASYSKAGVNFCTIANDLVRKKLVRVDWMGGTLFSEELPLTKTSEGWLFEDSEVGYLADGSIGKAVRVYKINRFGDLMIQNRGSAGWIDVRRRF